MSQILHIFRKDSRRFWPEILLSLAVYSVSVLFRWRELLIPFCWWLLIARVVQAETLVGENQAWLTRPYEWTKLLGAKLLFLAAYLYLPLAITQCLVLHMAGLHPAEHVGGLAYDWLLLSAVVVLPLFAIAAVTANFVRMTLTLLGVLLAFFAIEQASHFYCRIGWRSTWPATSLVRCRRCCLRSASAARFCSCNTLLDACGLHAGS